MQEESKELNDEGHGKVVFASARHYVTVAVYWRDIEICIQKHEKIDFLSPCRFWYLAFLMDSQVVYEKKRCQKKSLCQLWFGGKNLYFPTFFTIEWVPKNITYYLIIKIVYSLLWKVPEIFLHWAVNFYTVLNISSTKKTLGLISIFAAQFKIYGHSWKLYIPSTISLCSNINLIHS